MQNEYKKIVLIGTVASAVYGFRLDLIKELVKQGYSVYAFVSEYNDNDLRKIKDLGVIPVTYTLSRGSLNPFKDLIVTWQIFRKIKQIKPDIVFSYFSKPVIFGTIAARLANVPNIIGMLEGLGYTFTEQPEGISLKTKIIKNIQVFLYKLSLPLLDSFILLNNDDKKDLIDRYNLRIKNLKILGGTGINLNDYPYSPIKEISYPIKFIFIGRLLKEKGIYEFISAVKIVKRKYPDTIFTVLGSIDNANLGSLKEKELVRYIEEGLIQYPGLVSDVSKWINEHHVFVLPSYREGIPRSTQEAMAIGRAIITTNVPGCKDTVENSVNGFIVEKWNPKDLANKMLYFIENTDQIKIMGNQSYQIALQKFDATKINKDLIEMMNSKEGI